MFGLNKKKSKDEKDEKEKNDETPQLTLNLEELKTKDDKTEDKAKKDQALKTEDKQETAKDNTQTKGEVKGLDERIQNVLNSGNSNKIEVEDHDKDNQKWNTQKEVTGIIEDEKSKTKPTSTASPSAPPAVTKPEPKTSVDLNQSLPATQTTSQTPILDVGETEAKTETKTNNEIKTEPKPEPTPTPQTEPKPKPQPEPEINKSLNIKPSMQQTTQTTQPIQPKNSSVLQATTTDSTNNQNQDVLAETGKNLINNFSSFIKAYEFEKSETQRKLEYEYTTLKEIMVKRYQELIKFIQAVENQKEFFKDGNNKEQTVVLAYQIIPFLDNMMEKAKQLGYDLTPSETIKKSLQDFIEKLNVH
jgi:hypothetical protein